MVKVVKSCNEWSGERLGPALEAFTSRRDYPLAGQLISNPAWRQGNGRNDLRVSFRLGKQAFPSSGQPTLLSRRCALREAQSVPWNKKKPCEIASLCLFFSHGCLMAVARSLYNLGSNQGLDKKAKGSHRPHGDRWLSTRQSTPDSRALLWSSPWSTLHLKSHLKGFSWQSSD